MRSFPFRKKRGILVTLTRVPRGQNWKAEDALSKLGATSDMLSMTLSNSNNKVHKKKLELTGKGHGHRRQELSGSDGKWQRPRE